MRIVLGLVTVLALAAGCQKDASPEASASAPITALGYQVLAN